MSTQSSTSSYAEYLMLIRGTSWPKDLSPQQIEDHLTRFTSWVQGLRAAGKVTLGFPLEHKGKLFVGNSLVTDGPFIESKEAIAGLIIIRADSFEEAVRMVSDAPCLAYGQTLELRPIAAEPPEVQLAREKRA